MLPSPPLLPQTGMAVPGWHRDYPPLRALPGAALGQQWGRRSYETWGWFYAAPDAKHKASAETPTKARYMLPRKGKHVSPCRYSGILSMP